MKSAVIIPKVPMLEWQPTKKNASGILAAIEFIMYAYNIII